ncbi:MAG TPA: nuclear transport factor 2 family protein [Chloroflexota bacterium]|nr:nuclear transport factor 2 family protein [Chloroflexota bacterium]
MAHDHDHDHTHADPTARLIDAQHLAGNDFDVLVAVASHLRAAVESGDLDAYGALLADDVRWGADDVPGACRGRADVLDRLTRMRDAGMQTRVLEVTAGHSSVLLGVTSTQPAADGTSHSRTVFQVMTLRDGRISEIRGFPSRTEAAAAAGLLQPGEGPMHVAAVVPILNVSSLPDSFAWFEKLGLTRKWDWSAGGGEPTFGAGGAGNFEICLCRDGQGGRGPSGTWLAIWTDDVDAMHARCTREHLEVLCPPENKIWGVREMNVRHPDGHVFRISQPAQHHH